MQPTTTAQTPREVVEQCAAASYAGTASFGEIVRRLAEAGIDGYHADYRAAASTYYAGSAPVITVPTPQPDVAIAQAFDAQALQAAIRGAQRGEVKYPQFLRLSRAAGCVGYMVWIAGRHVSYFGQRGEVHVERFPD